jgi:hypothetical protein
LRLCGEKQVLICLEFLVFNLGNLGILGIVLLVDIHEDLPYDLPINKTNKIKGIK